jgi:hypothetical protein
MIYLITSERPDGEDTGSTAAVGLAAARAAARSLIQKRRLSHQPLSQADVDEYQRWDELTVVMPDDGILAGPLPDGWRVHVLAMNASEVWTLTGRAGIAPAAADIAAAFNTHMEARR